MSGINPTSTLTVAALRYVECTSVNVDSSSLVKGIQLVDPASVYMLVSKTKPCMPKYSSILVSGETADGSLNQLWSKWATVFPSWITVENPELIHATPSPCLQPYLYGYAVGMLLLDHSARIMFVPSF